MTNNSSDREADTIAEDNVQLYRQLLNDFFRMIVKLNSGID